jgi:hypothetical protein
MLPSKNIISSSKPTLCLSTYGEIHYYEELKQYLTEILLYYAIQHFLKMENINHKPASSSFDTYSNGICLGDHENNCQCHVQ